MSFTVRGSHVKLSLQQTKEAKSESEISFASDVIDLLMWHFYCTISRKQHSTEHTACISFWIPKRPVIYTDISFDKNMMKMYAIEIIFKSHEPFQSYQLTGTPNSARKAGLGRAI